MNAVTAVRERAWATRRAKYGPAGHGGAYSRHTAGNAALVAQLRAIVARSQALGPEPEQPDEYRGTEDAEAYGLEAGAWQAWRDAEAMARTALALAGVPVEAGP